MPRKKSSAQKARAAAEKSKLEQQLENADADVKKQVEEEFDSEDDDSSTSEEEDEFGELLTEDVEDGFNKVLHALKTNDKSLFDPTVKFFDEPEKAVQKKGDKHKPIYLKDYHRMNLLQGNTGAEYDDEDDNDDQEAVDENGERIKTYNEEIEEERNTILSEIKNAFNGDEDDEDEENDFAFMKKKEATREEPSTKIALPNPDKDSEKFLEAFVSSHAWIPQEGDKEIDLDRHGEDDEEFEEAAEKFEHAFNFRYEDPNSAEIISYARSQATIRRDGMNSRKRKRELEKEEKAKEKEEKGEQFQKKKTEELNKLTDFLEKIQKEYGMTIDEKAAKKISDRLLDEDFDDSNWDAVLGEIFDGQEDDTEKPTWDDDDEIMKDFNKEEDEDEQEDEGEELEETHDDKKTELSEKKKGKKDKKKTKEIASKVLEENKLRIMDKVEEEREGRSKERKETFKYREVSPETFGLTAREIFMADDADLNEFVGLKKLAPYRPKDLRVKDRRKIAKKRNVQEWRKKVFKNENGPEGNTDEILIQADEDKAGHHQKKSKKRKTHK